MSLIQVFPDFDVCYDNFDEGRALEGRGDFASVDFTDPGDMVNVVGAVGRTGGKWVVNASPGVGKLAFSAELALDSHALVVHVLPYDVMARAAFGYLRLRYHTVDIVWGGSVKGDWPVAGVVVTSAAILLAKWLAKGDVSMPECYLIHDECYDLGLASVALRTFGPLIAPASAYVEVADHQAARTYDKVDRGAMTLICRHLGFEVPSAYLGDDLAVGDVPTNLASVLSYPSGLEDIDFSSCVNGQEMRTAMQGEPKISDSSGTMVEVVRTSISSVDLDGALGALRLFSCDAVERALGFGVHCQQCGVRVDLRHMELGETVLCQSCRGNLALRVQGQGLLYAANEAIGKYGTTLMYLRAIEGIFGEVHTWSGDSKGKLVLGGSKNDLAFLDSAGLDIELAIFNVCLLTHLFQGVTGKLSFNTSGLRG